jgi:integrase
MDESEDMELTNPKDPQYAKDHACSTGAAVPDSGTAIVRTDLPRQRVGDVGPVDTYLASLAPSSRRTQLDALNAIARFLSQDAVDAHGFPWEQMTYPASVAVRAWFSERLAPHTVNRYLSALRRVLQEAWRLGLMAAEDRERASDVPPVRGSRLPAGRALQHDEVATLLQECRDDPRPAGRRDEALLAVLWSTGMRRAEIVGVRIRDVSDDLASIMVIGKGNKERRVYLNAEARAATAGWLKVRGTDPGSLFNAVDKYGNVRPGRHMTGASVRAILLSRAEAPGIAGISPHSWRRTHASELLQRTDLLTVQRLGGWADPRTVARYDRRPDVQAQAAVEGLRLPA